MDILLQHQSKSPAALSHSTTSQCRLIHEVACRTDSPLCETVTCSSGAICTLQAYENLYFVGLYREFQVGINLQRRVPNALQSLGPFSFCSRRMKQICLNYSGLKATALPTLFSSHCTAAENLLRVINGNRCLWGKSGGEGQVANSWGYNWFVEHIFTC